MKKPNRSYTIILSGVAYILSGCQAPHIDVKGITTSPDMDQNIATDQLYEQGKIAFRNNDMIRALRFFKAAHSRNPQVVRTLNGLGSVYDHLQRFDLAQTYYYRALALDPQSSATLNNLGYSHLLQNKPVIAVEYFRKAYRVDSSDIYVQHNLMIAEWKLETQRAKAPTVKGLPKMAKEEGDEQPNWIPEQPRQYAVVKVTSRVQELTTQAPKTQQAQMEAVKAETEPKTEIKIKPATKVVALAVKKRSVGYQLSLTSQQESYADYISGVAQSARAEKATQRAKKSEVSVTAISFTPQNNIVFVSRPPEKTAPRAAPVVEISNGAGRRGMAARMQKYIMSRDIPVQRLTNADHYSHMTSRIFYQAGWEEDVRQLVSQLPIAIHMEEVQGQTADIRLEIGGDLLAYDAELINHYRRKQ
ncbi:MAG: hypothetical protein COB54_04685 [Alphaproteobacteria bacterium]|nr:MAG: hypothetical protein COB54_04685 [Alphaproteobacteria bacterium]